MGATDLDIIRTSAHTNLNKKTKREILRKRTVLVGELVMKRRDSSHHQEAEVRLRHLEILPHGPVSRQKGAELGQNKILRISRTNFQPKIKRDHHRKLEIPEAPDTKCRITWIWTEFLSG